MSGERRTINDGRSGTPDPESGDFGAGAPETTGPHPAELSTQPELTTDGGILDWVVDNFTSDDFRDAFTSAPVSTDDGDGTTPVDEPEPSDLFD